MNAIILSIGDELVLGQTIDTNSAWISQQLCSVGCDILAHLTVADDQSAIERAMRELADRTDCLIVSGGIGPTADDLTRQALAAVMNADLLLSEFWLEKLRSFFEKRGRPMPEMNKIQAMIPRGASLIDNKAGTAAGIDAVLNASSRPCRVFVMPGVPSEMKLMFARDVLPHVSAVADGAAIVSRTLHTFGLGESTVAQHLGNLMDRTRNPSVGTTVSGGIVSLRVNARFSSRIEAEKELDNTVFACRAALGKLIFGQDLQTLPSVVADLLSHTSTTVAVAETFTGGLLAAMLTSAPGAESHFVQGLTAMLNEENASWFGLSPGSLQSQGPFSEAVTTTIAQSIRDQAGSTVGLAVSGASSPIDAGGNSAGAMVCVALSHAAGSIVRTYNFAGDRDFVRDRAAKMALALLRYHLLGQPAPF